MTEEMKKVPVEKIEGIGPKMAEKLKSAGIETTKDLLETGRTPSGRAGIAEKSGITEKQILEWVQDADLTRIKGVSEEYSDLLEEAGVKDVPDLATKNAESLHAKLLEVNEAKKIVRRPPSVKEITKWIDQAKSLPKVIEY
jgi:predicted flap endonuclease-1-like 5' DNA nuclease